MGTRKNLWFVALALLAVMASACGARVSKQQVEAAGSSGAAEQTTGAAASADDGSTAGTATEVTVAAGDGAPTATAESGTPTTAAATADSGTAAPAGGNGGATDIGVTADQIVLGNVSTMSGPVPGLFQGAVLGTQAFIAYQNSQGGIFGRKFKLEFRDDQFDTGQNRAATQDEMKKVFAFLGSLSLYDDAAVSELAKSNIPDLSVSLNASRGGLKTNFAVAPADTRGAPTGPFLWFKAKYPQAVTKVGTLYGDVPAAKISAQRFRAAAESVGWKFAYERGFQATETDFTADVVRMKSSGVKAVYLVSTDDKTTARIAKAMAQQGFKPDFFTANYMPTMPALAGTAAENMYSTSPFAMFGGEDNSNPEVALFRQWFQKVKPGATPDLFALYSWAEGRLMVQAMKAVGPKLTRDALNAQLAKIASYNANGLVGDAGPGTKRPSICYVIAQIRGGKYQRVDPATGYRCDGAYFRR